MENIRTINVDNKDVYVRVQTGTILHHKERKKVKQKVSHSTSTRYDHLRGREVEHTDSHHYTVDNGFENKFFAHDAQGKEFLVEVDTTDGIDVRPGHHISLFHLGRSPDSTKQYMIYFHENDVWITYHSATKTFEKTIWKKSDYLQAAVTVVSFFGLLYPAYLIGDKFNSFWAGALSFVFSFVIVIARGYKRGSQIFDAEIEVKSFIKGWAEEISANPPTPDYSELIQEGASA